VAVTVARLGDGHVDSSARGELLFNLRGGQTVALQVIRE